MRLGEFLKLSIDDIFDKLMETYKASAEEDMDTMILLERAAKYYYQIRELEKIPASEWSNVERGVYEATFSKWLEVLKELRKYRLKQKKSIEADITNLPNEEEMLDIIKTYINNKGKLTE